MIDRGTHNNQTNGEIIESINGMYNVTCAKLLFVVVVVVMVQFGISCGVHVLLLTRRENSAASFRIKTHFFAVFFCCCISVQFIEIFFNSLQLKKVQYVLYFTHILQVFYVDFRFFFAKTHSFQLKIMYFCKIVQFFQYSKLDYMLLEDSVSNSTQFHLIPY